MRATTIKVRRESLRTVLRWFDDAQPAPSYTDMLDLAAQTAEYLTTPWAMRIRIGLVVDQETGEAVNPQPTGAKVQLTDSQQVTYTITALDAKGYEVSGEDFSASVDDENVVTVDDQGNTFLAKAGRPGSAIITFTDGTLTATEALDVVPGATATIQIQGGAPEEQPAAGAGGDAGGGAVGGDTGGGVPAGGGDPAVNPDDPNAPVVNPLS